MYKFSFVLNTTKFYKQLERTVNFINSFIYDLILMNLGIDLVISFSGFIYGSNIFVGQDYNINAKNASRILC